MALLIRMQTKIGKLEEEIARIKIDTRSKIAMQFNSLQWS